MSIHDILQRAYASQSYMEFNKALQNSAIDVNELDSQGRSVMFALLFELCKKEIVDVDRDRLQIVCFYMLAKCKRVDFEGKYAVRMKNRKSPRCSLQSYAARFGSLLLRNILNDRACQCACCRQRTALTGAVLDADGAAPRMYNYNKEITYFLDNALATVNVAGFASVLTGRSSEMARMSAEAFCDDIGTEGHMEYHIYVELLSLLDGRWIHNNTKMHVSRDADRVHMLCFHLVLHSNHEDYNGRSIPYGEEGMTSLITNIHVMEYTPNILLLNMMLDRPSKYDINSASWDSQLTLFDELLEKLDKYDSEDEDQTEKVLEWLVTYPGIGLDSYSADSAGAMVWRVAINHNLGSLVTHLLTSEAYSSDHHSIWLTSSTQIVSCVLSAMTDDPVDSERMAIATEILSNEHITLSGSSFKVTIGISSDDADYALGVRMLMKQARFDVHSLTFDDEDDNDDDDEE